MKVDINKRPSINAILMMGIFTFVFLGLEYHYVNLIAEMADGSSAVIVQNYALGISAVGFLVYPLFNRQLTKRVKQSGIVLLAALVVLGVFLMESRISYEITLFIGMAVFLILGLFGSASYYLAMCCLETNRYLARHVGIAYALSILLQFANNNLSQSDLAEIIILSAFLLGLAVLLLKTEKTVAVEASQSSDIPIGNITEEDGGFKVHRSKETITGILLIVLIALMACIFSTLDNAVTLEHASGEMSIGEWPRIMLACSGLAAGFIFDIKRRKFMDMIMYCVMILSTICVAILQLGGSFLIGLIVFYLSSGFFVVFFTASFMELSCYMKLPELWAGMGRTANNVSAALITTGSLSLMSSDNYMMKIVVVLVMFVLVSIIMVAYIVNRKAAVEEMEQTAAVDLMQQDKLKLFSEKYAFTPREQEVFDRLVNTENSIQEISESMYISRRTCQRHITAIYEKVGVKSRMGLYQIYIEGKNLL